MSMTGSMSTSSAAEENKEEDDYEWDVDGGAEDGARIIMSSARSAVGGTLGMIQSGKMAGASQGQVRFSEPAPPARHDVVIMSL
mmetsp:Transcript_78609/g.220544  ORF Transcript_78609/g.220544 Transcript_78609/m.220544 type:complete len:84 (+) Transcript_78609:1-252(+)